MRPITVRGIKEQVQSLLQKVQREQPELYNAFILMADRIQINERRFHNFEYDPAHDKTLIAGKGVGINQDIPAVYSNLDVNGHILGIPCLGHWLQSNTIAGVGSYTWDTEVFNERDFFTRITGNTQIQINVRGKYMILAELTETGAGVAGRTDATTQQNATIKIQTAVMSTPDEVACHVHVITIDAAPGDFVECKNLNGARFGNAAGAFTHLSIYKLN